MSRPPEARPDPHFRWDVAASVALLCAAAGVAVLLFSCSGSPGRGGGVASKPIVVAPRADYRSTPTPGAGGDPSKVATPAPKPPSRVATSVPGAPPSKSKSTVVAFQPAHQGDTSDDPTFKEYVICGDIVDRAIALLPEYTCVKAWDIKDGLTGSNNYRPQPTNIKAFDKELAISNAAKADVFVAVHVDSGALKNWLLAETLPGDSKGKALAETLLGSLSKELGWKKRDPRLVRLYSLEPVRNNAKYRALFEIGDNANDRAFLENPDNRQRIAQALADGIRAFDASH
jgi:hypothetical protein